MTILKNKSYDPSKIYPPLLKKLEQLQKNCQARGVDYWMISGFRSMEEQTEIYALGRTKKNHDASPSKPMGSIVSKAKPGQSMHNYGLATDFALDGDKTRAGLQPDWDADKYQILAEEAKKLGLEAGWYWTKFKDSPHIELRLITNGLALKDIQQKYKEGGIQKVWSHLDTFEWK